MPMKSRRLPSANPAPRARSRSSLLWLGFASSVGLLLLPGCPSDHHDASGAAGTGATSGSGAQGGAGDEGGSPGESGGKSDAGARAAGAPGAAGQSTTAVPDYDIIDLGILDGDANSEGIGINTSGLVL